MYIPDDSSEVRVRGWRTLAALHCDLERTLEGVLRPHGLSVVEYTVLEALARQDGWHLRMKQLARVAALSDSAATRMVNRLEARGLLARVLCTTDRRGVSTELTAAGRDLLAAARPAHDAALCRALEESPLIGELAALLGSLAEAGRPAKDAGGVCN
ncbi:MarR family winged helix-turn-helix transcriptional regulator [Streptomyces rubradiris]|uniref:MarR family winged helix-turn-helix transcriptional regulator n=1 Tax=Streptomyces rubradiris TaxID=285531 RepID=UPI00340CB656